MQPVAKKDLTHIIKAAETEIYKTTGRRIILKPFENKVPSRIYQAVRLKDLDNELKLEDLINKYCNSLNVGKENLLTKNKREANTMLRYVYCHLVYNNLPNTKLKQLQHQLFMRDHTAVIHMKRTSDSLFFTKYPPFMNIYYKVKHLYEPVQEL